MEVLEEGGGVSNQDEGVVLSWGQGGGGSADDPLVISSNEDLEGEDSEVITAFSGLRVCCSVYNYLLIIFVSMIYSVYVFTIVCACLAFLVCCIQKNI